MQSILEYIMLNYTWFLGGAIIILLAIIGSYADKTNFGQGEFKNDIKEQNKEKDLTDLEEKRINDEQQSKIQNTQLQEENTELIDKTEQVDNTVKQSQEQASVPNSINDDNKKEESFDKFDQEFNEILPQKEIIDEELLDEINNLSLDKTQKIKLTDIPDLDDVELPKIKSLSSVDEDIWKF